MIIIKAFPLYVMITQLRKKTSTHTKVSIIMRQILEQNIHNNETFNDKFSAKRTE